MHRRSICIVIVLFVFSTVAAAGDKPLTNDDVIAMVKAGLDDSTVIAKIMQAGRTGLDTSVDALIKLKKSGVGKSVIDAMLGAGPAGMPSTAGSARPGADVQLVTSSRVVDLQSLEGEPSATYIGIGFLTWLNFDGTRAEVRSSDRNVALRVRSAQKPDSRVYVVRLEVNDSDRSVKMGRSRMFSATGGTTPDREWTFAYDAAQEQEGVWKLTLKSALPPGEYGLLRGSEIFDFGVE